MTPARSGAAGRSGGRGRSGAAGRAGAAPELASLAERVASWAGTSEDIEAYVSRETQTQVKVYEGEVESLSSATSAGVGIRVVAGGRQGFAYTGSLDLGAIEEALGEARSNAGFATAEPWVGLPEPAGGPQVALDLWRDELSGYPTSRKVDAALDLERQVLAGDPRIRKAESATWGDVSSEMAVASSLGVHAEDRSTACYLSAVAVAGEGTGSQVGGGYTVGRAPSDLEPAKAATDAVTRAVRLLGASKARSANLPVVFEPRMTSHLLGLLASALSGERALKRVSLFADRLGQQVAAPGFTLVEDPTNPLAWGASAFDDEGLPCRRNVLVDNGTLMGFLYDTTSARRATTTSTASAVRAGYKSAPGVGARAVLVTPGDLGPEEVLAKVGDGLLVQSLSGLHSGVNLVSGDFSVGAEGLMVRGGELAEPVREVTIASTVQRMLHAIAAVGNDVEWLPSRAAGLTLAVSEMSMSGA